MRRGPPAPCRHPLPGRGMGVGEGHDPSSCAKSSDIARPSAAPRLMSFSPPGRPRSADETWHGERFVCLGSDRSQARPALQRGTTALTFPRRLPQLNNNPLASQLNVSRRGGAGSDGCSQFCRAALPPSGPALGASSAPPPSAGGLHGAPQGTRRGGRG